MFDGHGLLPKREPARSPVIHIEQNMDQLLNLQPSTRADLQMYI